MKKKIVIFSGAGLDRESGILTFRDSKDGLWNNYKIDEVATPDGWKKDRNKVLKFYNERRSQLPEVKTNIAHEKIAELEEKFDVINITQNVSNLLERAGSKNVIHLHGDLTKVRGSLYHGKINPQEIPINHIIDIEYKDINIGDMCEFTNSQLRPHIVWFNESPFKTLEAGQAMHDADIVIIVGTSLEIGYTHLFFHYIRSSKYDKISPCKVYYVDPSPAKYLDDIGLNIEYIKKPATIGITNLVDKLIKEN